MGLSSPLRVENSIDRLFPIPINHPSLPSKPTFKNEVKHNTIPRITNIKWSDMIRLPDIEKQSTSKKGNSSVSSLISVLEPDANGGLIIDVDPWAPRLTSLQFPTPEELCESKKMGRDAVSHEIDSHRSPSLRIGWSNSYLSHRSRVNQAPAKICGVFPPSQLFHSALENMATVVGMKDNYPWYNYHKSLDKAFSIALKVILNTYNDVNLVSWTSTRNYYEIDQFTPPDVLWVLINTADAQILESLCRTFRRLLDGCPNTQRGVILTILLHKARNVRWERWKGRKSWSESMGLLFLQSGYKINEEMDIPRVKWSEIQEIISGFGRKRKRTKDGFDGEREYRSKRIKV
ncbi:uncharacterized protein I206_104170 [Kwoniella pini CBS 10737]|uniref:Uncharacterized protein n=1 Tax=Kwoniella pini CBS 10737 TaxID=1296096 RepID=A0A1B9I2R4_9TREE|nr:uncharacterized protein I206_04255 [Kwoniella pini CBS 10737]OCF49731.1 hypothetical protein I206_04255 [Kwoniella pini CBS 10737]